MVETKRELRVKRGISAESPQKAAIPFTDCGLYLWCRRRDSNSYRRGLLPPQYDFGLKQGKRTTRKKQE